MGKPIPFVNREISWLAFNERVLQEAADESVPLIERAKFIGIFSSNLDEFFRVRVGSLKRMVQAGVKAKATIGGSPKKTLREIHEIVLRQRLQFDKVFRNVLKGLEEAGIYIINENNLDAEQRAFVEDYFHSKVRPRLVPIMLDPLPRFPYLRNQIIYLAIRLTNNRDDDGEEKKFALIEVPADVLPRFIVLPPKKDKNFIIMLDDVIRCGLKEIFNIFNFDYIEAYTIKLTRDAEIDIDDDVTKSFFEKISKSLKQRQKGQPVRFVYDSEMPDDLLDFILEKNNLKGFENIISGGRYHNARDFMEFPHIGPKSLVNKARAPLVHKHLKTYKSIFEEIRKRDILLHYPYHTFNHFLDALREAAIDPVVSSIKITLYRVARYSNVINALINAIQNGKSVTVVMELQARFDEEANIYWTKELRDAGAHVIDGVPGLKVHSKISLFTRVENDKKVHYATIGTGNFNESTAKIYSDHTLFTADERLTYEVKKVFDFFENNYKLYNYAHLLISPFHMRRKFTAFIKQEIQNLKAGKEAYIYIKLNSLVDHDMIKALYKASNAGVKIKIIARGICSLIPGLEGYSKNIEAISIVDKYLEHSRIFIFCNDGSERYYISSADWMIRNLDNRVEVAAPIYDKDIQRELKQFFEIQFRDNTKSRILDGQNSNRRREKTCDKTYRAQEDIYYFLKNNKS